MRERERGWTGENPKMLTICLQGKMGKQIMCAYTRHDFPAKRTRT